MLMTYTSTPTTAHPSRCSVPVPDETRCGTHVQDTYGFLAKYSTEVIHHKAGKELVLADALNRRHHEVNGLSHPGQVQYDSSTPAIQTD